jgi:116 kDa U5 small nuclear ribonucleoprotein component
MTLALSDTRGKSYSRTCVEGTGHVQFHDEWVPILRLMDAAVLCVDVVEGVMMHTEVLTQQIIRVALPIILVLTKLDLLIVVLQLPPKDAHFQVAACHRICQYWYPKLAWEGMQNCPSIQKCRQL